MKIHFIERSDPEWSRMWAKLRLIVGSGDDNEQENNNEVWEYMGTVAKSEGPIHEFRHRCHPRGNVRRYERVYAIVGYSRPEG